MNATPSPKNPTKRDLEEHGVCRLFLSLVMFISYFEVLFFKQQVMGSGARIVMGSGARIVMGSGARIVMGSGARIAQD